MKICMYSPFSSNAPSSLRLLSFARVLVAKGHDITIVSPSYDRYSHFNVEKMEVVDSVKLKKPFQFKTKKIAVNMAPYLLSASLIGLQEKFDVVHILKPTPLTSIGYLPKMFRGTPTIQDIDDLDHLVMRAEKHLALDSWLIAQSEKIIPRFADTLVVSSSALKQYYINMGLEQKITQITNGVFISEFCVEKDPLIKQRFALKDKVIVYAGSLNNEVQLRPLLYSMQKVMEQRGDVSCLIIGDGSAKQSLMTLATSLNIRDNIVFTGHVPHNSIPSYLSVCDLGFACFPKLEYLRYASNIKVFEYMAAGIPAIVSPTGDLPFYVNFGNAGLISSPEPDVLSSKLSNILSDDRLLRKLSENARQYIINFDWTVLAKKLIQIYQGIV